MGGYRGYHWVWGLPTRRNHVRTRGGRRHGDRCFILGWSWHRHVTKRQRRLASTTVNEGDTARAFLNAKPGVRWSVRFVADATSRNLYPFACIAAVWHMLYVLRPAQHNVFVAACLMHNSRRPRVPCAHEDLVPCLMQSLGVSTDHAFVRVQAHEHERQEQLSLFNVIKLTFTNFFSIKATGLPPVKYIKTKSICMNLNLILILINKLIHIYKINTYSYMCIDINTLS